MDNEKIKSVFQSSTVKAENEYLGNNDKIEKLLKQVEEKLRQVPGLGDELAYIPIMASMVNSFIKNEYKEIPVGSIVAALGALIYFVAPIDLIPDMIPGVGLVDDAAVAAFAMVMIKDDLNDYIEWQKKNGKR